MTNFENLNSIFNLGRCITVGSNNKYIDFAFKYNLPNYRLISSGELLINGINHGVVIPHYMKEYISYHSEAIMIANILDNKVASLTLRSINTKKEFMKIGVTKSLFYGLGDLESDFKYGTPIVIVEGHLDRDVFANKIYRNTLAVTTNKLSRSQLKVLSSLTNKVVLMLDNDDAGRVGQVSAIRSFKKLNINYIELPYPNGVKDAGDLLKLEIMDTPLYNYYVNLYKSNIFNF